MHVNFFVFFLLRAKTFWSINRKGWNAKEKRLKKQTKNSHVFVHLDETCIVFLFLQSMRLTQKQEHRRLLQRWSMMTFPARNLSLPMKVGGCRIVLASDVCSLMTSNPPPLTCRVFVCPADMIYEDVQRDSVPLEANNGWSSSEFESYDEQSDNDAKLPARSKVDRMSNLSWYPCIFNGI